MVYVENELIGRRLQDIRESAHMGFYDMAKLDVDPLYLLAGSQKGKNANLSHSEIRRRRVCELLDYCRKQIGEDVEV